MTSTFLIRLYTSQSSSIGEDERAASSTSICASPRGVYWPRPDRPAWPARRSDTGKFSAMHTQAPRN